MLNFYRKKETLIILALILYFCFFVALTNYAIKTGNEFPELAWSFIHGKTYLLNENLNNVDLVNFNNHLYWHMPPLPAIVLTPLALILQQPPKQNAITFIFNILLGFLIYYFVKSKFNFSKNNSLWLVIAYLFASIYIATCMNVGTYGFAHLITTILIFLSLLEFFGKKRFWLIGILLGLILLTRVTAFFTIIFFILALIFDNALWKNKVKNLIFLFIPAIICFLLLCSYNYLRFDNFLESGYTLTNAYLKSPEVHPHGLFSLKYIPTNFYYYFLESFKPKLIDQGPLLSFPYILPNKQGALSFFLVSPLFLLIFKADLRNKIIKYSLITSVIILLVLLSYYWNGWPQIGPRYINDFLPLLFIIMLFKLKGTGLKKGYKLIIVFSALLNVYLCLTLLNVHF